MGVIEVRTCFSIVQRERLFRESSWVELNGPKLIPLHSHQCMPNGSKEFFLSAAAAPQCTSSSMLTPHSRQKMKRRSRTRTAVCTSLKSRSHKKTIALRQHRRPNPPPLFPFRTINRNEMFTSRGRGSLRTCSLPLSTAEK